MAPNWPEVALSLTNIYTVVVATTKILLLLESIKQRSDEFVFNRMTVRPLLFAATAQS